jgi:hypothetical protein
VRVVYNTSGRENPLPKSRIGIGQSKGERIFRKENWHPESWLPPEKVASGISTLIFRRHSGWELEGIHEGHAEDQKTTEKK